MNVGKYQRDSRVNHLYSDSGVINNLQSKEVNTLNLSVEHASFFEEAKFFGGLWANQMTVDGEFQANALTDGVMTISEGKLQTPLLNYQLLPSRENPLELVTQGYVDNRLLRFGMVEICSLDNVVGTYDNGDAGVGATLTGQSNGILQIDAVNVVAGDLILLAFQDDPTENGVYVATIPGSVSTPYILTRSWDWDGTYPLSEGLKIYVAGGTLNKFSTLRLGNDVTIVGEDALFFDYVSNTNTNPITAGTNINLNLSNVLSLKPSIILTAVTASTLTGNLTTPNQPLVTSLGTLTSLDVSGETTLTGTTDITELTVGNLTITDAVVLDSDVYGDVYGNVVGNVNGNVTGTVNTASQPSIQQLPNVSLLGGVTVANQALSNISTLSANAINCVNLTVTGLSTTASSITVATGENLLRLSTSNATNLIDGGFIQQYVSSGTKHRGLVIDATDGVWKLFSNSTQSFPDSTVDFSIVQFDDLQLKQIRSVNSAVPQTYVLGTQLTGAMTFKETVSNTTLLELSDVSGVTVPTNLTVTGDLNGVLTTASQPNLTNVGALEYLRVDGNILFTLDPVAPQLFSIVNADTADVVLSVAADGQTVVGDNSAPSSCAQLQVNTTTRGFLPPVMTTAEKNAIADPVEGLMVYDSNLARVCVYSTGTWKSLAWAP